MAVVLTRLVELQSGKIEIDDIDISKIDLAILRDKITVIPQDPTLFTGTLRYNIDPLEILTDEDIETLARKVGLMDLQVKNLTKKPQGKGKSKSEDEGVGLNFQIKENGSNLSVGERQLVCFCRAVLKKNKIVLLDEATANIDIVTEQKI